MKLFTHTPRRWITPGGQYFTLYGDMSDATHLLIAGTTGSGKSVVINGILHSLLVRYSPVSCGLILIDPKRVELVQYAELPHVIRYASEPGEYAAALQSAMDIVEDRYQQMRNRRERKYTGGHVYVIIDELADLMTTDGKKSGELLQRLCQIGRAANVHVIAATQCPLASVIPTAIKVNFDYRLGLHTRTAQDSRNILGVKGCETLPRFGLGHYLTPDGLKCWRLPMVQDADLESVCTWWSNPALCTVRTA